MQSQSPPSACSAPQANNRCPRSNGNACPDATPACGGATSTNTSSSSSSPNAKVPYVCIGDTCMPLRSCKEKEMNGSGGASAAAPSDEPRSPMPPCTESQFGWKEYSPQIKHLFTAGKVWAIVAPPCALKHVGCAFQEAIAALEHADASLFNDEVPWLFPKVKFVRDDHIRLCEKATSVYGKSPFIALIDMPHSTARVFEIMQHTTCGHEDRVAFSPVELHRVSEFVQKAAMGTWPKAPLGEAPPPNDEESEFGLVATNKAVQCSIPRLVRGEVRTFAEAKIVAEQMDSFTSGNRSGNNTVLQEDGAAAAPSSTTDPLPSPSSRSSRHRKSGSLLVVFTIWAERCPCCPPVIKALDTILSLLKSTTFREQFPQCPLYRIDATVRHVICDADRNDMDDSEWPTSDEGLDVDPVSPALRPSSPPQMPNDVETGDVILSTSSGQQREMSLPSIMTYCNGRRVARFRGVRTAKNLVNYVARSFGLVSVVNGSIRPLPEDEDAGLGWLVYLQSVLERMESEENLTLRKRSRGDH